VEAHAPSTNKLINRVFLFTPVTQQTKKIRKQGITETVKFFFMSMEIRDINPVGPMVLKHLKNHIDGLYEYFMKGKTNEESVGASLTKDIDKYCQRGYNLIWSDLLNRCMVDYNIIHVLKTYVGTPIGTMVSINRNYYVSIHLTITSTFQIGMPNKRNIERKFQSLYTPSVGVTVARELLSATFKSGK
jgi:hypothetical protein